MTLPYPIEPSASIYALVAVGVVCRSISTCLPINPVVESGVCASDRVESV